MYSLIRCEGYQRYDVYHALAGGLESLGGFASFGLERGMRVLVKPNLIRALAPDSHATTHPEIVRAACLLLRESGMDPFIAESPGGPYKASLLRSVYNACGITAICAQEDIECNLETRVYVENLDGLVLKKADFIKPLQEADALLNLAKLKTHGLTLYTGAVKNLFGLIPGTAKAQSHYQYAKKTDFLHMLLDIYSYAARKPALHIMDAVFGMEGNGPTSGSPRYIGALALGSDAVELDAVCSRIIGIDDFPMLRLARERGMSAAPGESRGLPWQDFKTDFTLPDTSDSTLLLARNKTMNRFPLLRKIAERALRPKPHIRDNCVGCGICARDCPAQTIAIVKGKAHIRASKCIHCYCCQELCPHQAVEARPSLAYRLLK